MESLLYVEMVLYLVQLRFFFPLLQFLWLQGQAPVSDWWKGQQYFCGIPPSAIGGLAILSYGETSFTDRIANGQFFRALCTALV